VECETCRTSIDNTDVIKRVYDDDDDDYPARLSFDLHVANMRDVVVRIQWGEIPASHALTSDAHD